MQWKTLQNFTLKKMVKNAKFRGKPFLRSEKVLTLAYFRPEKVLSLVDFSPEKVWRGLTGAFKEGIFVIHSLKL